MDISQVLQGMDRQTGADRYYDDKRVRLGRFLVTDALISIDPETARALLGEVVVIRAEARWWDKNVEYTALGTQFDWIDRGDTMRPIPLYRVKAQAQPSVDGEKSSLHWTFEREGV